jgi:tetratricopeptide (TPR) repeat protein
METNNRAALLGASFLVALSTLTKYYGACLIPLLVAYSIVQKRRLGWWALYFLIPVAILVWYETATRSLYGKGLFSDAAVYAGDAQDYGRAEFFTRMMITLSFTGGCLVTALFYAPLLWSRRALIIAALGTAAGIAVLPLAGQIGRFALHHADGGVRWALVTHTGLFAAAGIGILALSISDLRQRRDAGSWLLFLWLVGTFIFAGFINWTANGRSILPMAPAVGILLMRRIDQRTDLRRKDRTWLALPLVPAAVLGLMVARADYVLAGAPRSAIGEIRQKYDREPGTLWFQGHWGFQWYMGSVGARICDVKRTIIRFGEIVVSPKNNTNTTLMPPEVSDLLEIIKRPSGGWLTTLSQVLKAGFYASEYGPVPYIFGNVPPEQYRIYRVRPSASVHLARGNKLSEQGKIEEAMREYRKAISLDPDYADPHVNLGVLLKKQGRRDEAIREYETAIYIKPDSAEAHNNLAIEYYYKRDYAAAWREVRLARRFGHNPHPVFLRALSEKMPEP